MANPLFYVNDIFVGEFDGSGVFTIGLSQPATQAVSITYSTGNLNAAAGSDYTNTTGTITFNPGERFKSVNVPIINNSNGEIPESFTFNLSNATGGAGISKSVGIGTILDNDFGAPPAGILPNLWVTDFTIDEKAGFGYFFIILDRPSGTNVNVNYQTVNRTAIGGSDYKSLNGTVTFGAQELVKRIAVEIIDDTLRESGETFDLSASTGNTAINVADSIGTGIIAPSDQPTTANPTVNVKNIIVGEGDGQAVFTVNLSQPSNEEIAFYYLTSPNPPTIELLPGQDGGDYYALGTTQLISFVFAPGETSKSVSVALYDGAGGTAEATEVFNLITINQKDGAFVQQSAAILDNDVTNTNPNITVSDVAVNEQEGVATFTITLSQASTQLVSFNYATVNGSAVATSDFVPVQGSLSFAPGQMVKQISVGLLRDSANEPTTQTFGFVLSDIVGGNGAKPTATGTITNDPTQTVVIKSDFNGDGNSDILMTNNTNPWNGAALLNGVNYLSWLGLPSAPAPWNPVAVGDMNNDGHPDIVVSHAEFGWNGALLWNGTSYIGWADLPPTAPGWTAEGVGDFDKDGFQDILLQNTQQGWLSAMALNGSGISYKEWLNFTPTPGWNPAGVGDLNGDTYDDILLYNPATGRTAAMLLRGTESIGWTEELPFAAGTRPVGLADFDGDNSLDILIHNTQEGWNGAFLMNGTTYKGYTGMPSAAGWTPLV